MFKYVWMIFKRIAFEASYRLVPLLHMRLVRKFEAGSRIKVAFVVFQESIWKTDTLFKVMLEDPNFEPFIIAVEPRSIDNDFCATVRHFEVKGYQTKYIAKDEGLPGVLEIFRSTAPDIVFIPNHYQQSFPGLYRFIFRNFLTCYVPYSLNVSHYRNDQDQYNSHVHNLVWKNYAPHVIALETFRRVQSIRGANVVVTGYPSLESLVKRDQVHGIWKDNGRKRVIWAPHHTIDMPELPYANFLKYAEFFRILAIKYSETISWAFKPHPILRGKLEAHIDWGKARTDEYYRFWDEQDYTQLEVGAYEDLFKSSDAMIHDSGSFIAEYLYVDKPVMFLWSSSTISESFNDYGKQALIANEHGDNIEDIEKFLEDLLENRDAGRQKRANFLRRFQIDEGGSSPSEKIMLDLKNHLMKGKT